MGPDAKRFRSVVDALATAWANCDADAAAELFTDDALYMEPPDRQLFVGREQIRAYFTPLELGTYLNIHATWFDPVERSGAIEFSFGVADSESSDHGVAVIHLRDDLICSWREYHYKGPSSFRDFLSIDNKTWEWNADNYP